MSTGEESARRIHNGLSRGPSDLSSWPKKRKNQENSLLHPKKPSMEDLRSELLRRDPTARCASLSAPVLAKRLLQLPPKEDNETVATDGQVILKTQFKSAWHIFPCIFFCRSFHSVKFEMLAWAFFCLTRDSKCDPFVSFVKAISILCFFF